MAAITPTNPSLCKPATDPYVEDVLFRAARDFAVTDAKWSVILRHYGISDSIRTGMVSAPAGAVDLLELWADQ